MAVNDYIQQARQTYPGISDFDATMIGLDWAAENGIYED